jgi:hypothetical protein
MVTATTVQTKLDRAYGKLSMKIGVTCSLYRATDFANAITGATLVSSNVAVRFDPMEDFKAQQFNGYGHPVWTAALDRTTYGTQVGDYLVTTSGDTYFIATQQSLLPTAVVSTNRVISVFRPQATLVTNTTNTYRFSRLTPNKGQTLNNPIMLGFPCSMLAGTKGEREESGIPLGTREPWCAILLPFNNATPLSILGAGYTPFGGAVLDSSVLPIVETVIMTGDLIQDDLGIEWEVSSVELTDLGYRITAARASV